MAKIFIPEISAIGIEVNEHYVSGAVVKAGPETKTRYVEEELPAGVVADGKVQDRGALVKILKRLGRRLHTGTRYAVLSIPETDAFTEVIRLPAMPPDQVNEFLDLNTPASLPFSKENLVLGWQDVEFEAMKSERAIYLVSASRTVVSSFTDAISEAGFVPMVVEPTSLSVARLLPSSPERVLLVYLRGEGSVYTMVQNGIVDFSLYSSVGLNRLKVGSITEGSAVTAFSKEITGEISKVLRFQGQGIKKIVYSSEIDIGIADAVKAETKLPVERLTLPGWTFKEDERIGHMLPALGAGLRGSLLSERDKEPSLLPFSARLTYHFRRAKSLFRTLDTITVVATLAVLVFLFAGYGVLTYQKATLDNRAKTADISDEDQQLIKDIESVNEQLMVMKTVYDSSARWTGVSALVITPSPGIRFTGYQATSGNPPTVNVSGHATTIENLQTLLSKYRQTPQFDRVDIPNQFLGQKSNINFTMKLTIKPEVLKD